MAAISMETNTQSTEQSPLAPGIQALPPYRISNGIPSQTRSKLSVDLHNVGADVDQSKISFQGVNGVFDQSVCSLQTDMSNDIGDSILKTVGMKTDVNESSTDPQCGLCGRTDIGEVCHVCSNVNHQQVLTNDHSEDSGSVKKCTCKNLKEPGSKHSCHCFDTDSRSGQNIHTQKSADSISDQEPISQNSTHTSSVYMSSTDNSSVQDPNSKKSTGAVSVHEPHSENSDSSPVHEPHSKNSTKAGSDHEPQSQDPTDTSSVPKYCSQDLIDFRSVHKSHSQKTTDTTSGHKAHSRNFIDTSLEHHFESDQVIAEYQVITSDDVDASDTHGDSGRDQEISVEIIKVSEKEFSFRTLSKKQLAIVISFCMVGFANYLCLSLIAPFFPKEAREKGVSNLVSGWIFAAFPLTQFIFAPAFGKLIPIVGLKFMYLSGTFISGGCTILFGMMTYVDVTEGTAVFITMCFVLRVTMALGCCANQTASFSLCAQEFKDTVGTIFGLGEVFVGLGFMCGPAIGGVLYGVGGFLLPFTVIGGIIFLTTILNYWIVPTDEFVHHVSSSGGVSLFLMIKSYKTVVNCLTITVAAIIWSILDPTLEPHLEEFNLSSELIGLLFLLMAAVYAIASPIWGWISDRVKDSRIILVFGCLMSTGGMLLLGPSTLLGFEKDYNELWLNIVSLVIIGVADSAAIIPTFDLLFKIAEERGFENNISTYSIIAGLWGSMYALG
ncbi:MFS-type transporter SLC18B1-like isoform X2 [Mizuhopecten yessoensis]|nr:MFS-type transporter SLC18B1-like isoform X2 [Mizuhopecten yessoensis]